jgi:transcriptional regulator with XRE-family HTH domain
MSYKMKISKRDRSAGRFKSRVHRALMKAVIAAKTEKGMTQSQIAELMEVDKSVVSRILNGQGNLTLKTIGEISWVLGLRPDISFVEIDAGAAMHANHVPHEHVVAVEAAKNSTDSNVWVFSPPQKTASTSRMPVVVSKSINPKDEVVHAN